MSPNSADSFVHLPFSFPVPPPPSFHYHLPNSLPHKIKPTLLTGAWHNPVFRLFPSSILPTSVRLIFLKPTLIKANTLLKNYNDFLVPIHQSLSLFNLSEEWLLLPPFCTGFRHTQAFASITALHPSPALWSRRRFSHLKMRKLRFRAGKWLASRHTSGRWWRQN